jgi:hypothetical protein
VYDCVDPWAWQETEADRAWADSVDWPKATGLGRQQAATQGKGARDKEPRKGKLVWRPEPIPASSDGGEPPGATASRDAGPPAKRQGPPIDTAVPAGTGPSEGSNTKGNSPGATASTDAGPPAKKHQMGKLPGATASCDAGPPARGEADPPGTGRTSKKRKKRKGPAISTAQVELEIGGDQAQMTGPQLNNPELDWGVDGQQDPPMPGKGASECCVAGGALDGAIADQELRDEHCLGEAGQDEPGGPVLRGLRSTVVSSETPVGSEMVNEAQEPAPMVETSSNEGEPSEGQRDDGGTGDPGLDTALIESSLKPVHPSVRGRATKGRPGGKGTPQPLTTAEGTEAENRVFR